MGNGMAPCLSPSCTKDVPFEMLDLLQASQGCMWVQGLEGLGVLGGAGDIRGLYDIDFASVLGEGGFGKVLPATSRQSGERYAVKELRKRRDHMGEVMAEIHVMSRLSHANVVRLQEVYVDSARVFLVMDLCYGSDLLKAIHNKEYGFREKEATAVLRQVLRGVSYMHQQMVCHRDVKLENLMLGPKDGNLAARSVKIIDFGFSWSFRDRDELCFERRGTERYMAPEVLAERYTYRCDNFSCGVVAHVLLSGHFPFTTASQTKTMEPTFARKPWPKVREEARELVGGLLRKDPRLRLDGEIALGHPWLREHNSEESEVALHGVADGLGQPRGQ